MSGHSALRQARPTAGPDCFCTGGDHPPVTRAQLRPDAPLAWPRDIPWEEAVEWTFTEPHPIKEE